MSTPRVGKKQKPLLVIDGPVRASVYRGNFKPFAITRLLDASKVKKARKLSIEVGTIEAAGKSATLIAQVEKGMITKLALPANRHHHRTRDLVHRDHGRRPRVLLYLPRRACRQLHLARGRDVLRSS